MEPATPPTLAHRRRILDDLQRDADTMLIELGQVIGLMPPTRMATDPQGSLEALSGFCAGADLKAVTADGATWLLNRIGLAIARSVMLRHGGRLVVQDDPARPFYLNFVVVGMAPPVRPDARLDPFGIAHALVLGPSGANLLTLVAEAEAALQGR